MRLFVEELFAGGLLRRALRRLADVLAAARIRLFESRPDLCDALVHRVAAGGKASDIRPDVGEVFHRGELARALFVRDALERGGLFGDLGKLCLQPRAFLADRLGALFVLRRFGGAAPLQLLDLARAAQGILDVVRRRLKLAAVGLDALSQYLRLARLVLDTDFKGAQLFVDGAKVRVRLRDLLARRLLLPIEFRQTGLDLRELPAGALDLLALPARLVGKVIKADKVGIDLLVL